MTRTLNGAASVVTAAVLMSGAAQAASLDAIASANYRLELELAGSDLPADVTTATLASFSDFPQSDVSSVVDHPDAETTVVLEDPFADAFNTSASRTVIGDTGEGTEVSHVFDNTAEVYLNGAAPVLGTREFVGEARAEAQFSDNPAISAAQTTHEYSWDTSVQNTSGNRVSFNIIGTLEVDLSAQTEGDYSFASSNAFVGLDFYNLFGTDITYLPLDTFFLTREENGLAATRLDMFTGNDDGLSFDGAAFTASNGDASSSALTASHRFLFNVVIQDGGRFSFGMSSEHIVQTGTAPV